MNTPKSRSMALTCAVLIGASGLFLAQLQKSHRLGAPGLKLCSVSLVDEHGKTVTTNSVFLPERILDYSSDLLPVTQEELQWLPCDTTFGRRLYKADRDGFMAQVSGVMMGTDRTSIHKPEYCLPAQGFRISRRTQQTLTIERPVPYELPITRLDATREVILKNGTRATQGAVYVYWFVSGSRLSNDHFQRMWWLASDLIRTGELQRWAYMGVLGACPPGQEDQAFARLSELIRAMVPEFQTTTAATNNANASAAPSQPAPPLAAAGNQPSPPPNR